MTPLNRMLLATSLLAAPVLLSASEVIRKYVARGEVESGDAVLDARDKIAQVAAEPGLWQLHSYLTLVGVLAWLGAMIAVTAVVSARRPILGAIGGVLGVGSGLGYAAHIGFYTVPLGTAAGLGGEELDAAATVWAAGDGDGFSAAVVLVFIATMVFGQLVIGLGLWRAHVAPWWAAACLPLSVALTLDPGRSPLWGLPMLLLVVPFAMVARSLGGDYPTGRGSSTALPDRDRVIAKPKAVAKTYMRME
jgi:hypothetical protein